MIFFFSTVTAVSRSSESGDVDATVKERARKRVFGEDSGTLPGDMFISPGGGEDTCQHTAISNILPVDVQQYLADKIEKGQLDLPTDMDISFSQVREPFYEKEFRIKIIVLD